MRADGNITLKMKNLSLSSIQACGLFKLFNAAELWPDFLTVQSMWIYEGPKVQHLSAALIFANRATVINVIFKIAPANIN